MIFLLFFFVGCTMRVTDVLSALKHPDPLRANVQILPRFPSRDLSGFVKKK